MIVNVKENGWKYTPDEKVVIVINGMQNVVSQVASHFNISKTSYYRWKNIFFDKVGNIFKKQNKNIEELRQEERENMKIETVKNIIDTLPPEISKRIKRSNTFRIASLKKISSRKFISLKDALKSVGLSSSSYYRMKKESVAIESEVEVLDSYKLLFVIDILLDHPFTSALNLCIEFAQLGIKLSRDNARSLRRDAVAYIIKHKLRQNSKLYTFLNEDCAWCADFSEFYIDGEKHYLFKIIDDYSRFDIATAILKRATTANALEVINEAIERWGRKPLSFKTNRGTQFKKTFASGLKELGISHIKSYPEYPKFNTKIERRFLDFKLFLLNHQEEDAKTLIIQESNIHNYVSLHKSLGGLTCEVYWGGKSPPDNSPYKILSIKDYFPNFDKDIFIKLY
ncbi:UNVERIFIED_CONTAM: integrase-like protein [Acetivibrio alkalicellulosi]